MNTAFIVGGGSLRAVIEDCATTTGLSLNALTVMSRQLDPFRIDTPAAHRDSKWLREAWETSKARRPLHLRGIHYALVMIDPPLLLPHNAEPYANSSDCWDWLLETATKARWLGHIPFDSILDERNAPPIVHDFTETTGPRIEFKDGAMLSAPFPFQGMLP